MKKEFEDIARKVRLVVLDVDGVLTDGAIILGNDGVEMKAFHVRDGHGMKLAQRAGLTLAVITGRRSEAVARRMRELALTELFQGVHDKVRVYEGLLKKYGLSDTEAAFMGDDVVDLPLLDRVGLRAAPADADPAVIEKAHFVSKLGGGRGAVRELLERILKARGLWAGLSADRRVP